MSNKKKKLVLMGTAVVHTFKYLHLIEDYFDEILLITDQPKEGIRHRQMAFNFSMRNPFQMGAKIRTLRQTIDAFAPDIVHVHQANSCAWYAIKACGKRYPLVVTAWGSDILATPNKGFLYRQLVKYIMTHAHFFTSDALYMAELMRKYAGTHRPEILIANFGIDISPATFPREKLVYSNRQLTPLYRIDEVITHFNELIRADEAYHEWRLAIAATGPEEHRLKKQVEDLGLQDRVRFYGWVNRETNTELYSKATLYISIPESDATSISLLEAMACGCLPVVSDLPANREWIRDNINGIIVQPGEKNVLRRALQINVQEAQAMNAEIIGSEGTKAANKAKFIALYDKMLHGN